MISGANGGGMPPKARRPFRPTLRQATFILPKTGERVKRAVTFGDPLGLDGVDSGGPLDDRSPLLGQRRPRHRPLGSLQSFWDTLERLRKQTWNFANSQTGRGVLKCSLAYSLGSLATFLPFIADFLGQQNDGKHLVATVTVYFHPARSKGSMFEAMLLASLAFAYAVFICYTSMGVSIFFGQILDLLVLGHIVVLVLFCGGGLGLVGWVKQRLGNPLVNVACSLTSLATITVLTKEGAVQAAVFSNDKVYQVLKMVVMGVATSTAVSFLISPVSARKELKDNLIQVTDSFADMLTLITRSFLTGSEEELQQKQFLDASNQYRAVFTSLNKNLREAKFEHYVMGTEREYKLEAMLVDCMQRLAQNIGGLRSAASTQFLLLAQPTSVNGVATPLQTSASYSTTPGLSCLESYSVLTAIDEAPEEEITPTGNRKSASQQSSSADDDGLPSINSPADIFSRFIVHLGPSMKSLAITLKQILDELPYGPGPDFIIAINPQLGISLGDAVELYTKARQEALTLLYKNKELSKARPIEIEADYEEVAASCGHFSFSLQYFANEMKVYLDILDDLKLEVEERSGGRTWSWLKIWRRPQISLKHDRMGGTERDSFTAYDEENDVRVEVRTPKERQSAYANHPEVQEQAQSFSYRLWKALSFLRRDDTKFAIKVGFGAALYALPSFLVTTRPIYQHFRGEWGLLSYMLVCSMTIGASNTTSYARFLGTCIGAICAMFTWTASRGNPFALATFGWLMSFWTSYIIVAQGKGPMGRFIMLTYNLSALYAYSLSVRDMDDDDDEGGAQPNIADIAFHRVVAVLSGCLWGLIITRFIWPISAKQKFKDGLSLLWLRMGLIWKRDPLAMLLEGESPHAYMDLREEFELHGFLTQLENLRSSATSEMGLRGPFPNVAYGRILKSTASMLDAFHAMNVIIMKDCKASKGEAEILGFTVNERNQLGSRISHLFQVLASSMKLEFPLNDALPNTDHARDRLLARIFHFRKQQVAKTDATDEDFALLYAYALVTGQLSKEINEVGKEIEKLFGVLNEDLLKLE